MKNLLITIFTFGIFFTTTAQSGGFGVHAGLIGTGLYNLADGGNEQFESNSGIIVGVRYNLKFGPIGFCPELNYVNKKYDQIGDYDSNGNVDEWAVPTEYTMNYLSMPLLAKLYLGPINIHGGVQTSILLSGTIKDDELDINYDLDDDELQIESPNNEEYSPFEDMDVAAVFGIGVDLKIGVYMSARATVSLTPVNNMKLIQDWADEANLSEDEVADILTEGNDGTDGLNRYITTQFTVGYAF
jgi:hypothetical protein